MNDAMNGQPPVVEQPAANTELKNLVDTFNNGVSWFFFVAGLSVVNSLLVLFGADWSFIFGLGITQIFDGIAVAIAGEMGAGAGIWIVRGIVFVFNLAIAGFFVLFGWLSKKGYGAAFLIGIVLYVLDGLLFLVFRDWMGLAFHALAVFPMVRGYLALRKPAPCSYKARNSPGRSWSPLRAAGVSCHRRGTSDRGGDRRPGIAERRSPTDVFLSVGRAFPPSSTQY